jgi:hypothetical protein
VRSAVVGFKLVRRSFMQCHLLGRVYFCHVVVEVISFGEGEEVRKEKKGGLWSPVTKPDILLPAAARRSTSSDLGTTRSSSWRWRGAVLGEGCADD